MGDGERVNEELKEKLRNYADGKLSPEEKDQLEQDFKKIEEYDLLLEDEMNSEKIPFAQETPPAPVDNKGAGIIKKAKWKARLQNALTAVGIIFLGTILCTILSAIYYSSGNPDRIDTYHDIVESTLAVTEPNLRLRTNSIDTGSFFSIDLQGKLTKQIGRYEYNVGEFTVSFLLNQVGFPERKKEIDDLISIPFNYPGTPAQTNQSDWAKLDKLPEGTVSEVYLSFDRVYSTDEVLQKFSDKDMQPVWFAVDTGLDNWPEYRPPNTFMGFPYHPVWLKNEMTTINQNVEKKGWFLKVVSKSFSSPVLETYGSADLRNQNFLNTLNLLKEYEKMANRIAGKGDLRLQERIDYLNQNGIGIYGAVATGPSKEILKLKNEPWISGIIVGEVRFWNWSSNYR